ncbi:hypothetical protein PC116_g10731 [Phytophthora cactorum]|uniref:Uncharacterized protein n=1 Tax=Phytophthora cactorum TaxID=29920 RepID=A0A8T1E0G2_9STRA|nr:hypothetical protein Pcac1_g14290 [Phytophthora cactorum]KAG2915673.1 hypothetical protein PC114_g7776 [Phytophthora cactorum]KAG2946349.1 hypothetical protein PC117_g7727 [Phytophthora cactorum]KAG3027462.1 hypothetical protein PC119_g7377 [Phytophthora cactorum]KAG3177773.1 hypothetical protein C6341_g8317 [Phytophthora cactorum]
MPKKSEHQLLLREIVDITAVAALEEEDKYCKCAGRGKLSNASTSRRETREKVWRG